MSTEVEAHWRDSARSPRFWIVDSKAVFPLVLFLLHIRIWTLEFALVTMFFFTALEHYGFTVPVFLRWLRVALGGRYKVAKPWWKQPRHYY